MRSLSAAAAVAAAALLMVAQAAGAPQPQALLAGRSLEPARMTAPGSAFRDTRLDGPRRLAFLARGNYWGGPITARTGETVNVTVSESYPVDDLRRQEVADFLAGLYHGPELASLTVYLAPLVEVQSLCGEQAYACYSLAKQLMVIPGEDTPDGTSVETVLAHEYGHHVAAHRDNAPWLAFDWGTKRWATYQNVCERKSAGTAFPGDEGPNYGLNPGEAFAETFRVLNYQRYAWPGWLDSPWSVDESWHPDTAALAAVLDDVLTPWLGGSSSAWKSRFAAPRKPPSRARSTKSRAVTIVSRIITAPRDGLLSIRLVQAPRGTTVKVLDPLTSKIVGSTSTTETRGMVCGHRRLKVTLTSPAQGGVAVTISLP